MEFTAPLFLIIAAWLLDILLGEPAKYHPLVIYGHIVKRIELWLHRNSLSPAKSRWRGVCAVVLALTPVLIITALTIAITHTTFSLIYWAIALICVYFTMAYRALCEHALEIYHALNNADLQQAREALAKIVSRDTTNLNEKEISSACIESVLENGSDAIFAAWFWWVFAGIPGVILYRLANTLDAMWGYKSSRYLYFGWAAARLDDLLNYLPARTTALSYCLAGHWRTGWQCWMQQGSHWKSPNAGPVMAAGAGSLKLRLGGAAVYHGEQQQRPELGRGKIAEASDIPRALTLLRNAMWIWLLLAAVFLVIVQTIVQHVIFSP
ncbi:Cobalamin biosynthesis protein CobD [Thalassocella blandensis]|nr:Cobalamin biosynthesis protein CobD [Thalassocella blandensis]